MPRRLRALDRKPLRDLWEMKAQCRSSSTRCGAAIGDLYSKAIVTMFDDEVHRLSLVASRATVAWSFPVVVVVSGLAVNGRLDRLDPGAVLKTRG